MIDKENIKKKFLEYVDNFEKSGRVDLKKEHILRVADKSEVIAKSLNLSEEQIELAYLIGICHDIGRFEQIKRFDTFSDKLTGMNHAQWSNKVLFEDGLINEFINTDKYHNIIKTAVINHNKTQIEGNLSEEELLFSKIIRDADKLDILYVINIEELEDIFWYKEHNAKMIDKSIILDYYAKYLLDYSKIKNNLDQIVTFYNYIYDINFKITLTLIKEGNYYETFNKRIKEVYNSKILNEQLDNLLLSINNYIKFKENE